MCGRAGRRGMDDKGNIFILMGDKQYIPNRDGLVRMLKGVGTKVQSKFRINYKTIISFYSRNLKNIVDFFKDSFLENNKIIETPENMKRQEELTKLVEVVQKVKCEKSSEDVPPIEDYFNCKSKLNEVKRNIFEVYT